MRLLYRVRFRRDHQWAPAHMSEYVDGELAPAGRARMERHTRDCPECERVLAGLRALVTRLGRVGGVAGDSSGVHGVQIATAVRGRLDEPS
jgi:anti-sigma factor RsiW